MTGTRVLQGLLIPGLVAGALLVAACGNDDDSNGSNDNGTAPNDSDAVTEIVIEQHDNYFEPDEFVVKAGAAVTVTTTNEGAAVHNLVFKIAGAEGQDVSTELMMRPGDEETFELVINTPGEYVFQCDFHLPEMVGTVIVVE